MKTRIFAALIMLLFVSIAQANPPILVDRNTGQYLGNLSSNQFDPDSVNNQFGRYGSEFSPDSINNQFGQYGSQFSPNSVNNEFATSAPVIIHRHNTTGYNPIGGAINGFFEGVDKAEARNHTRALRAAEIEALSNRVALIDRNRILENELSLTRQEREAVRRDAYIHDFYDRGKAPTEYSQYAPPSLTDSDVAAIAKRWEKERPYAGPSHAVAANKPEALTDLSKAPKWSEIAAKPEYSKLAPETQIHLKNMYFDYWVVPRVSQQQAAALRQQFLSMEP